MRLLFLYITLIICSTMHCHAQVDSTYIELTKQPLSIRVSAQEKSISLEHDYNGEEYKFISNNPTSLGIGISWKKTSIGFGYGFPFMRDKKKGKTRAFDFQYHYYGQKYIFDILVQRYKGFYLEDHNGKFQKLAPDLGATRYGVSAQYVFNNKKFSHKASYNHSERQIKSAGSFLLGGGITYSEVRSDSSLVDLDDFRQKNFQVGINGGYAYTFVFKKNYYISASITIGVNVSTDYVSDFYKRKIEVYPSFLPRIAMGYNGSNWSLSVSALQYNSFVFYHKNNSLSMGSGTIQISFVKRINFQHRLLDIFDSKVDKIPRPRIL